MPQHLVTYGRDRTTGYLRYIEDVDKGVACHCVCLKCGGTLEAHKGNVRRHHFKHYSAKECKGAFESQIHLLSKDIIEENKLLMLPDYKGYFCFYPQHRQQLSEVIKECPQDDLQPDCLCKYYDDQGKEQILWVEIFYTHAVDEEKIRKIEERKIACVEIDVSQLFKDAETVDKNKLTDFLLNSSDCRKWINYPQGDEQIQEEANEIRTQGSIIPFLIQNSDDEKRIGRFQTVIYCLFSTEYRLQQKDLIELQKFVFNNDYKGLTSPLTLRYISAVQILLCYYVTIGKLKERNAPMEQLLFKVCFNRDQALPMLSNFKLSMTRQKVVRQNPQYDLINGRWRKRRRF